MTLQPDVDYRRDLVTIDDFVPHHFWHVPIIDQRALNSLSLARHKLVADVSGLSMKRKSEPLWREMADPSRVEIPPGITAPYLRVRGCSRDDIIAESNRFPELPRTHGTLQGYHQMAARFVEMAASRDRFLTFYDPRHVAPAWLVAQLALAFPDSRIAVLVTRKVDVMQSQIKLRRLGLNVTRASSDRSYGELPRISIGTHQDFVTLSHRLTGTDFMIVSNAIKGLGKNMLLPISSAFRARLVGLVPITEKVAPDDCDLFRAVFGFDQVTILRRGIDRPPRVAMIRSRCGGQPANAGDIVAIKRLLIWNGHQRNRLVRKVARAVTGVGPQDVFSPDCAACINDMQPAKVAVLVENREHAQALANVLRHWPVIARVEDASDLKASESFSVIVTLKSASSIGLVDVLIRADGGVGVPSFLSGYDLVPRLIIDFDDRQYAELRIRSRSRREAYRKLGWFDVGEDTYMARIDDFLATRPEVRDV